MKFACGFRQCRLTKSLQPTAAHPSVAVAHWQSNVAVFGGALPRRLWLSSIVMHKLIWFVAVLTAGFSLCGCSLRPAPHARLRPEESLSRVAVARANQEAKRLYDVEPFRPDQGTLRGDGDGWIWQALTSSGQADVLARVTFERNGSVGGVVVQMFSHPRPSVPQPSVPKIGADPLPSPRERPLGPPEIIPR